MKLIKQLKSDIFRKSIVKTWFVSYIATLLIPIVFLASFYFLSNNITEKNIDYSNELMIGSVSQNINTILSENTGYINFVSHSPAFSACANLSSYSSGREYYTLLSLSEEISKYNRNIAAKNRFYIYFNNLDVIVTSESIYQPKSFFDSQYSHLGLNYIDWFSSISSGDKNFIRFPSEADSDMILSIYRFPTGPNQSSATLITDISSKAIDLNIKDNNRDNFDIKYIVFDQNGNIAMSSFTADDMLTEQLKTAQSEDKIEIDSKKYDSNVKILDNNYKLVCLFEHSRYSKNINTLNMICIAVIVITLFFGAIVISRYIKIQYSPIENILEALSDIPENNTLTNEYDVVKDSILKMKSENRSARSKIELQNRDLANSFLIRLLSNNTLSQKMIDNNLKIHNISFSGDSYCVISCTVDSYDALFSDMPTDSDEEKKLETILFAVTNVTEEYAKEIQHNEIHTVTTDNSICYILSCSAEKDATAEGLALSEFVSNFFFEKLNVLLKLAISSSASSIYDISQCYSQSKTALSYAEHIESPCVVSFEDIRKKDQGSAIEYQYTSEVEQRMINFIETGNAESCSALLKDIFPPEDVSGSTALQLTRTKACNIIGTIEGIIEKRNYPDDISVNTETILYQIINAEDYSSIISIVSDTCISLCESFANNKLNRISDSILDYIEENYSDVNLGVSTIADALGLSRSYVSTKFKEQFGIGINEYINKYRIKKAKELLNTEDYTLNTISQMIGYSDSRTFIRIFKKYEDTTPGKYRSSN